LAGLVQKLTASLGGTARFWRARRYVRARWFYAMRWLFGRRHVASETRAYITAARYLARRSALSIVLAASLVLALHFAERSWTALVCDVGLGGTAIGRTITRPVDRGTYAILLQSVAAVTGVFLALYFAAVSTVAATVYSEVPHDIRDLMLRDKLGNFYVRAVAFLSALAIFLLVEQASGGAAYHLALPIVALLAGFAVFAFISLGQRAFYFSDPTVLSQLVVGDFLRSFSDRTGLAMDRSELSGALPQPGPPGGYLAQRVASVLTYARFRARRLWAERRVVVREPASRVSRSQDDGADAEPLVWRDI
jgi:hypothetical protein